MNEEAVLIQSTFGLTTRNKTKQLCHLVPYGGMGAACHCDTLVTEVCRMSGLKRTSSAPLPTPSLAGKAGADWGTSMRYLPPRPSLPCCKRPRPQVPDRTRCTGGGRYRTKTDRGNTIPTPKPDSTFQLQKKSDARIRRLLHVSLALSSWHTTLLWVRKLISLCLFSKQKLLKHIFP